MIDYSKESYKLLLPFALIFAVLVCSSCSDNGFYYDVEGQVLLSCGTDKITLLVITNQREEAIFVTADWQAARERLDLRDIPEDYLIEDELGNQVTFQLENNMLYMILNSTHGDASSQSINIKTDSLGIVVSSSRVNCQ